MTSVNLGRRMTALAAVIAFMFAALVTRLWFLQVLAAEEYRERAEGNLTRITPIPAPRGRILDRKGAAMVDNVRTTQILVDKDKVEDPDALLARLSTLLDVPVGALRERYEDPDYLPYQPVPVWENVPEKVIYYLEEHQEAYPAVGFTVTAVRRHVQGNLAPHVLGYLGQISPEELEDPSFSDYLPGQLVGRGGVEQAYEAQLRGEDGREKEIVDADGDVQASLGTKEPEAGDDLVLAVDADIQALAQETLNTAVEEARGLVDEESGTYLRANGGAVLVMDPNSGHVLAMASYPSYDPRVFGGGLNEREYRALTRPSANYPLNNRVISGLYPPGSTFKPFVAAAAVKAGYAKTTDYFPCPSEFEVPGDTSGTVFHNWKDSDAGHISFAEALIQSCDTVFYPWGLQFWRERQARGDLFQKEIRSWGFGETTGIEVPGEQEGRVPDARWKQEVNAQYPEFFPYPQWLPGDSINLSIGQGDLLVTPLQLAVAYSALANGGTLYRPQLALRVQDREGNTVTEFPKEVVGKVPVPQPILTAIGNALRGVVSSGEGTATSAFAGFPLSSHPVAGKTGTSEVAGKQPYSWFAAFAPADNPQFVVVSVVEEGGHGSQVAAPIVRRVLEGLLDLEPGAFQISTEVSD